MLNASTTRRRAAVIIVAAALLAITAIFTAPLGAQSGTKAESRPAVAQVRAPKVIAVKFHADWCGFCKAMGPVFTDLQNKTDGEPALFVTFDLTNQTTKNQAELLAAALGLSDLWTANGGSTGKIYLVDASSKATVATLTHEQSLKDMTASLKSALQ